MVGEEPIWDGGKKRGRVHECVEQQLFATKRCSEAAGGLLVCAVVAKDAIGNGRYGRRRTEGTAKVATKARTGGSGRRNKQQRSVSIKNTENAGGGSVFGGWYSRRNRVGIGRRWIGRYLDQCYYSIL